MSREILQDIINEFDLDRFIRFFRNKSQNFNPRQEPISEYDDEFFSDSIILGEIKFVDTGERLIVCALKSHKPLSERASKKAQYEKGRKILKAYQQDAGIFIFYDTSGSFRLSLIYPQYFGAKRTWNNFRRFTYFVNKAFANKTFLMQISSSDFSSLDKIKEAFSIAKVTDDFYKEFMPKFEKIAHSVSRESKEADADQKAHDFALLFGIRVIFLGFIQKRGWLGSDEKFLQNFLNEYNENNSKKDKFYKQWLKPLFFEALNSPIGRKVAYGNNDFSKETEKKLQMAPYLNGGLFQEKEIDGEGFLIPDNIIQEFFDFLFSYNFTIEENTLYDEDLELNPEFLGIIFERLVNKADGAVYTPRTEVDLMCRLALVKWLEQNVAETVKKESLYELLFREGGADESYDPLQKQGIFSRSEIDQILDLLENITICDPAVGSGAFPVGMLHVLDDVEERLRRRIGRDEEVSGFERKKRIINQSLYGVEVKEWAVWITQLRLWTTLFIDAPDKMRHSMEPILPSLDFKIRQGDSLVQRIGTKMFPVSGHANISASVKAKVTELRKIKKEFFQNKEKDSRVIKHREFLLFKEILSSEIKEREKELAIVTGMERNKQLEMFEDKSHAIQSEFEFDKEKAERIKNKIVELEDEFKSLREERPLIWNIEFAEIFSDKGGFDIVIGNPPYVRQEDIADPTGKVKDEKEYKNLLAEMVKTDFTDAFGKSEKINAQSDLYTYFYVRGLRLLNGNGIHTFICSNSWLDVGYGIWLQKFLLNHCPVHFIIDNHAERSFAVADVNTIISVIGGYKKHVIDDHITRFVAFKKPFEVVVFTENLLEIERSKKIISNDRYRVYPVSKKDLLGSGTEKQEEGLRNIDMGVYIGDKWGGKYLKAPDIYFRILERGKDKFIRLGDVANIKRGFTTGANDFFYLTNTQIQQWKIEKEYLKSVIKSPRECHSILVNPDNLEYKVFMCGKSKDELGKTNALKYIEWGEKTEIEIKQGKNKGKKIKGFQNIETTKNRRQWWTLSEDFGAHVFIQMTFNDIFKIIYSEDIIFADARYYEVKTKIKNIHMLLNSSISTLFIELYGRANLGEGALDFKVYEAEKILILKPDLLKEIDNKNFKSFMAREIKSIFEECGFDKSKPIRDQEPKPLPDRKELDDIIFDILDLTKEERKEVYWAVCELVKNRLEKAKSV